MRRSIFAVPYNLEMSIFLNYLRACQCTVAALLSQCCIRVVGSPVACGSSSPFRPYACILHATSDSKDEKSNPIRHIDDEPRRTGIRTSNARCSPDRWRHCGAGQWTRTPHVSGEHTPRWPSPPRVRESGVLLVLEQCADSHPAHLPNDMHGPAERLRSAHDVPRTSPWRAPGARRCWIRLRCRRRLEGGVP